MTFTSEDEGFVSLCDSQWMGGSDGKSRQGGCEECEKEKEISSVVG